MAVDIPSPKIERPNPPFFSTSIRMPTLCVNYTASSVIEIPDDVKLMSVEDNAGAKMGDCGSWWIKWNVLHYYDAEGQEHKIDGGEVEFDAKRPSEEHPPDFYEPIIKAETECFYCRAEAFGTYGEKNLPMCRSHKHSTGNSDTDDEEEKKND